MFEDTNPWAAYFANEAKARKEAQQKAQAKAAKTRAYKLAKPQAILALEADWFLKRKEHKTWDDRTANGLTAFVIDWLQLHGHYAARINTGGTAIGATGAGGREAIKWTTSGSTKGVADVIACIGGRFVQIEIKAGKDRPRKDQLEQQQLTQDAGGIYAFVHNADEAVAVFYQTRLLTDQAANMITGWVDGQKDDLDYIDINGGLYGEQFVEDFRVFISNIKAYYL